MSAQGRSLTRPTRSGQYESRLTEGELTERKTVFVQKKTLAKRIDHLWWEHFHPPQLLASLLRLVDLHRLTFSFFLCIVPHGKQDK